MTKKKPYFHLYYWLHEHAEFELQRLVEVDEKTSLYKDLKNIPQHVDRLADALHARLHQASKDIQQLVNAGWEIRSVDDEIVGLVSEKYRTVAEVDTALRALGIDLSSVDIGDVIGPSSRFA